MIMMQLFLDAAAISQLPQLEVLKAIKELNKKLGIPPNIKERPWNLIKFDAMLRDESHSGKVGSSWITGAGCQGGGFREAGRQRYEGCLRPHQPTPTHAGGGHWALPSSLWAAVLRCYRYKQMAQMGIGWWSDVLLKHRFEIVLWIQFDIN